MSPKPILYFNDISPPVRTVLMTVRALNIDVELREIDLIAQDNKSPQFLKMNPLHRIPILKCGDGDLVITDSHAISSYLADEYAPDSQLYPKDARVRAKIHSMMYFDSGLLFPRESAILQSPFQPPTDTPFSNMVKLYKETLSYLEAFCEKHDWLAGDHMTLADLCCISTYSSGKLMVRIDQGSYPNIDAWEERCKAEKVYELANEPGLENLKEFLKKYGKFDHVDDDTRSYIFEKINK